MSWQRRVCISDVSSSMHVPHTSDSTSAWRSLASADYSGAATSARFRHRAPCGWNTNRALYTGRIDAYVVGEVGNSGHVWHEYW